MLGMRFGQNTLLQIGLLLGAAINLAKKQSGTSYNAVPIIKWDERGFLFVFVPVKRIICIVSAVHKVEAGVRTIYDLGVIHTFLITRIGH